MNDPRGMTLCSCRCRHQQTTSCPVRTALNPSVPGGRGISQSATSWTVAAEAEHSSSTWWRGVTMSGSGDINSLTNVIIIITITSKNGYASISRGQHFADQPISPASRRSQMFAGMQYDWWLLSTLFKLNIAFLYHVSICPQRREIHFRLSWLRPSLICYRNQSRQTEVRV